jgi:Tfp pilus assembly protein FimV
LDNDTKKYVSDVEKYNADSNNYKVAVTKHNARCSGQLPDAGFIAECNAKASELDEWSARLTKESADLRQWQKELKDRIAELDAATKNWIIQKKKNDENLKEVSIKQQAWLSQVRAFLSTPVTKNLVRKAGVTQACAKINEKEKSEGALKKISEKAIQCLQKLYGSIY